MRFENDYANAINQALKEQADQLRDYGGLMAQAGIPLKDMEQMPFEDWQLVREGYARQLNDYPNG
jgi:hypothetical protein